MVRHKKSILVLGFFLLFIPSLGHAQRVFGILWKSPAPQVTADQQLHQLSETGFSYLQVEGLLANGTWKTIDQLGFKVYAALPIYFPIEGTFQRTDSTFNQKIKKLVRHYQARPSVKAIGLFSYGQVQSNGFQKEVSDFIKEVLPRSSKKLYYLVANPQPVSFDRLFGFKVVSTFSPANGNRQKVGAWVYTPPDDQTWSLIPLKHFLTKTSRYPDKPVFFDYDWLRTMSKKHPQLESILSLYAASASAVFPIPRDEQSASASTNIIVIALLLIWTLFGMAHRYDLLFQSSFYRYFFSHKFYVNDVVTRKIRTFFSGYSILIQHCLAGGIIYYCTLQIILSELGRQALFFHFPIFSFFGTGHLELFLWGVIIVLIIEILSVTLLFTTNRGIAHINQMVNLYCWPLQLNSFTATIAAFLFLIGGPNFPAYVTGGLFILILFGSFAITAKDTGQYLRGKNFWFFTALTSLYFIVLFVFIGWLMSSSPFICVVQLATSLP